MILCIILFVNKVSTFVGYIRSAFANSGLCASSNIFSNIVQNLQYNKCYKNQNKTKILIKTKRNRHRKSIINIQKKHTHTQFCFWMKCCNRKDKGQTMICKTLYIHRKQNIEQHEPHYKPDVSTTWPNLQERYHVNKLWLQDDPDVRSISMSLDRVGTIVYFTTYSSVIGLLRKVHAFTTASQCEQ